MPDYRERFKETDHFAECIGGPHDGYKAYCRNAKEGDEFVSKSAIYRFVNGKWVFRGECNS